MQIVLETFSVGSTLISINNLCYVSHVGPVFDRDPWKNRFCLITILFGKIAISWFNLRSSWCFLWYKVTYSTSTKNRIIMSIWVWLISLTFAHIEIQSKFSSIGITKKVNWIQSCVLAKLVIVGVLSFVVLTNILHISRSCIIWSL